MADRIIAALTRRRLGGAVLVVAGIVVAAVVLWPGGTKAPTVKVRHLPARIVSVPPLGMGFAHPESWTRDVSKAVIRLRSADGSVSMFISSPAVGSKIEAVKAGVKRTLLAQFKPAKIVHEGDEPLGLRRVASFELRGKDKGKAVRALEMVDATQYRTYAVTVVTQEHPSSEAFKEARAIISTVRFSKPTATPAKKK